MGEGFFLAGLASNACVQAQAVTVSSGDPLYAKAELQNSFPSRPFRFGDLAANPWIIFDNNIIANGNFEDSASGVLPAGWNVPTGGGTPVTSTVQFNEGAKSMVLDAANEAAYQDRILRPGGTYRLGNALRGDGTNIVSAYVLDLLSGKWLLSGGTWSATKTAITTRSTATFATYNQTFTLEAPLAGHVGPAKIRILFDRPGTIAGAAYVDSVYLWPKITCAALMYDTIPAGFTVAVQSDDDIAFPSATANGNMPARRFRRYLTFAGPATLERYWRFLITGTPFDLFRPWIGQPVLGERETFLTKPSWGIVTAREMPKAGTPELPASLADAPRYRFDMSWESPASSYNQIAEKMLGASFYGDEPVMVVPETDDTEFVYGRGAQLAEIAPSRDPIDSLNYRLSILDDGYPVATR